MFRNFLGNYSEIAYIRQVSIFPRTVLAVLLMVFGACSDLDTDTDSTETTDLNACSVDTHMHINSNISFSDGASQLLAKMEPLNVGSGTGLGFALLTVPPQDCSSCSGLKYTYETDKSPSLKSIVESNATKLGFLAGGGTLSPTMHGAVLNQNSPTQQEIASFKTTAQGIIDDGALGFGELAVLHISFNEDHPYIAIPAEHPYFLALADVAAENAVTIDIHLEAINSEDFTISSDMPNNCYNTTDEGGNNPDALSENISGFKTLLSRNYTTAESLGNISNAKIVWSHVGWDNTGHLTVSLIRELMKEHPNLYANIAMLDNIGPCQVIANRPLDADGNLQDDWLELFQEFPDRFILGADEFMGNEESITAGSTRMQGTWDLIAQLPSELAQKFACDNPRSFYNIPE